MALVPSRSLDGDVGKQAVSARRLRRNERYRRILMKAPVPYRVVEDWVAQTRDLESSAADAMVGGHLAGLCTCGTFGTWTYVVSQWPAQEVDVFLADAIRNAYLQASWKESILGTFAAIGFETIPQLSDEIWDAGVLMPPVMAAIADAALEASPGRRLRGKWRRALVLLTRTDLASVIEERQRLPARASVPASAVMPVRASPLPPLTPPPAPEPVPAREQARSPATLISVRKLTQPKQKKQQRKPEQFRPSLHPVAAIAVRSRECTAVETYLMDASKRDLNVETVFLATALTYRPKWRLLFEKPVSVKIGSRRVFLSSVTATMRENSIALRFHTEDARQVIPASVIIDFRQRTYISGDASLVALVLLDLLFADESRLIASQAAGDWLFAGRKLDPEGQEAAAVYRLSDRPRWVDGGASGQLMVTGASSARKPHDVRGYRQTREGKTYRVKPYHRSS